MDAEKMGKGGAVIGAGVGVAGGFWLCTGEGALAGGAIGGPPGVIIGGIIGAVVGGLLGWGAGKAFDSATK